jgi:hypothetical protein
MFSGSAPIGPSSLKSCWEGKVVQDFLHFEHLSGLFRFLRPFARILGPWPFVMLSFLILAFLAFVSFELCGLAQMRSRSYSC